MNSSTTDPGIDVRAERVVVTEHHVTVDFIDGRTISVPLTWYPRVLNGTAAERANFEIWDDGLYWPDLNGDISFSAILLGRKSGESAKSFERWLDRRAKGEEEKIPTRPLPTDWAKRLKRAKAADRRQATRKKSPSRVVTTSKRRTA
ncbi:MAG: DUF2442 domain-containing protein [Tepidisphaeraceae bacterium]